MPEDYCMFDSGVVANLEFNFPPWLILMAREDLGLISLSMRRTATLANLTLSGVILICTPGITRTIGLNRQLSMPPTGLITRRYSLWFAFSGMAVCEGA